MASTEVRPELTPQLMAAKATAIGRIAVLGKRYWEYRNPSDESGFSRNVDTGAVIPTLRTILSLLDTPYNPNTWLNVTYKHGYGRGGIRGMHFDVEWSPSAQYEKAYLVVAHGEEDPSTVIGVAMSSLSGPEAVESEGIVTQMLQGLGTPFIQARLLAELSGLFAEPQKP